MASTKASNGLLYNASSVDAMPADCLLRSILTQQRVKCDASQQQCACSLAGMLSSTCRSLQLQLGNLQPCWTIDLFVGELSHGYHPGTSLDMLRFPARRFACSDTDKCHLTMVGCTAARMITTTRSFNAVLKGDCDASLWAQQSVLFKTFSSNALLRSPILGPPVLTSITLHNCQIRLPQTRHPP